MTTYRQVFISTMFSLTLGLASPALAQSSYAEIKPILEASCLSCHGPRVARAGVRFDSEANAVKFSARALEELTAGRMPPRRPSFATSAEGQRLVDWFAAQAN